LQGRQGEQQLGQGLGRRDPVRDPGLQQCAQGGGGEALIIQATSLIWTTKVVF